VRHRSPAPVSQRGAILVESAIVTASVLTLVLGMVELGLIGFLQITTDAGAFLNAHQNAIGVNDTLGPADATHQVFPQIQTAAITNTVQTAPSPAVPVNYGYNGTAAQQQVASTNRHGGASILQPYLTQTTITQTPFTFIGSPFRVHSQASEAYWLESDATWDAANANYGTAYAAGNNALNANVFKQGENVPLYYMSLDFVYHCATPGSWGSVSKGVCPAQDTLSLGTGEYLDNLNWSNGTAGVGGAAGSTGPGGSTGTFEAAACHQRELATLSYFFENLAENNYGNSAAFAADPLNYIETTYNPYFYNQSGYTNFSSTSASFFGQWPNGATAHSLDTIATQTVRIIYGWDLEHYNGQSGQGSVGSNPLHPTLGCV
jgi:hypothetical protein